MNDCAFLYLIIGSLGKIALSFGWFLIRYQFSIIMDFMFGAAGLNVVTNGKICLFGLGLCFKASLLVSNLTSANAFLVMVSG